MFVFVLKCVELMSCLFVCLLLFVFKYQFAVRFGVLCMCWLCCLWCLCVLRVSFFLIDMFAFCSYALFIECVSLLLACVLLYVFIFVRWHDWFAVSLLCALFAVFCCLLVLLLAGVVVCVACLFVCCVTRLCSFVCCLCLSTCLLADMIVLQFRCCCCCLLPSGLNGCFFLCYMFDLCSYYVFG